MRHVVLLAALLMTVHAATLWGAGPFDDDYICYRYARNLLRGHGLVFQPGQAVEGYTNPLWVLLMAGVLALDLAPTVASRAIGIGAAAVAVWAVGRAWRARYPDSRLSPALVVAALPAVAWHAVAGLGTTLLAALLALAFLEWDRGRARWVGLWLALACLLRQEAALFALPFAAGTVRRDRLAAALPVAALVGWTAFRWFTYGRLLPMPWYVKKLPLLVDWGYGLRYVLTATVTSGVGVLALLAPAARAPWRPVGWLLVLHTLYVVHVGGDFVALARFHVPVLPLLVLLAGSALRERSRGLALGLGVVLALGVQWLRLPWSGETARRHPLVLEQALRYRVLDHRAFEDRWERIGRTLARTCPPDTTVATSPIGAIGWTSDLPLVDMLGLTNELALGVEPDLEGVKVKGHHRLDASRVLAERPDLLVLGNGTPDLAGGLAINPWERPIVEHERFREDYRPFVLPIPGDVALPLWVRRGTEPPRGARSAQ